MIPDITLLLGISPKLGKWSSKLLEDIILISLLLETMLHISFLISIVLFLFLFLDLYFYLL